MEDGYTSQGSDLVHEAYTLAAQLVGRGAFTQAVAAHSATTGGASARQSNLAAMLSAIVVVLFGSDAEGDEAEGGVGRAAEAEAREGPLAAGVLELVQQCTVQAQRSDTPTPTRAAVLGALFTATPVLAPTLAGATRDAFAATLLQIAACAHHVLQQEAHPRKGDGTAPFSDALLANGAACGGRNCSSMDASGMRSSSSLPCQSSVGAEEGGIAVSASGAIVHVIRALQGTQSEVQLVTDTIALLRQVLLPPHCDAALLAAVFTASAHSAAVAAVDSEREGLRSYAGQLTVQVADDVKTSAAAAAGALHVAQAQKVADGATRMDAHSAAGGPEPQPHDADVAVAMAQLTHHVRRAAALLQASWSGGGDVGAVDGEAEAAGPVAAAGRALLPMLCQAVPVLAVALSADGTARPACVSQLRQAWGETLVAAVQLDTTAAVGLVGTVFDVIAERASVDALVDWQHALATMIGRYLPRDGGHAPTADRVLRALQKIWALPELQVRPAALRSTQPACWFLKHRDVWHGVGARDRGRVQSRLAQRLARAMHASHRCRAHTSVLRHSCGTPCVDPVSGDRCSMSRKGEQFSGMTCLDRTRSPL